MQPWGIAETPLHRLCLRDGGDRAACFKLLRDAGANLEAIDFLGNRPLHCAVWRGNAGLLSLLVKAALMWMRQTLKTPQRCTLQHAGELQIASKCSWPQALLESIRRKREDAFRRSSWRRRRIWPLFLRAGAEIPTDYTDPYILVRNAGGFKKYEQAHITRITAILAPTPRLPPEMVRKIVEFWLHAGRHSAGVVPMLIVSKRLKIPTLISPSRTLPACRGSSATARVRQVALATNKGRSMRLKHVCARGYAHCASSTDVSVKGRKTPSRPCSFANPPRGHRADPVAHRSSSAFFEGPGKPRTPRTTPRLYVKARP